ncbi:MAG TPA: hypothetical protein VFL42_04885, partial [Terriglobales bacterium]|nr:hypothetical protein [Terriglobales bacterium]
VLPELPCHITQRGVDRREVFSTDQGTRGQPELSDFSVQSCAGYPSIRAKARSSDTVPGDVQASSFAQVALEFAAFVRLRPSNRQTSSSNDFAAQ